MGVPSATSLAALRKSNSLGRLEGISRTAVEKGMKIGKELIEWVEFL